MTSSQGKDAAVIAEYNFVSGLIPFYRRMELAAVGGAGVVVAALIGALGALEGAAVSGNRVAIDRTEVFLLALAPWVFFLTTLMMTTALVRIRRASLYIQDSLSPFYPDVFQWETVLHATLWNRTPRGLRWLTAIGEPSFPLLLSVVAPAVVSAFLADFWASGARSTGLITIGYTGAAAAVIVGGWAALFSWYHESRGGRETTVQDRRVTDTPAGGAPARP